MFTDIFNTDKKYQIIYADPPWSYRQQGSKKTKRGMAKQHYDTMTTEEICNLPIKDIKTDDAILFMWATFPNIFEAEKVISAWGFEYKTAAFVWVKKNKKSATNFWGMGAYTRANAEPCLLAISKKTKAKQAVKRHDIHQIIEAPIMKHSEKPPITRQMITNLVGGVLQRLNYSQESNLTAGTSGEMNFKNTKNRRKNNENQRLRPTLRRMYHRWL